MRKLTWAFYEIAREIKKNKTLKHQKSVYILQFARDLLANIFD